MSEQYHRGNHFSQKEQRGRDHIVTASIDRLVTEVPTIGRETLLKVEELPLEQQANVFKAVSSAVPDPERLLFQLSTAKKMRDHRYEKRDDPYFIDPLVHLVVKGHRVVVVHEEPQGGVSRHQARFLGKIKKSGVAIVVNLDDPDIIALGIGTQTEGMGLQMKRPQRKIGDPPIPRSQLEDLVNQTDARGTQGLFELYMGDKGHPAFKTGREAEKVIEGMTTDEYKLKMTVGTVTDPARYENAGVITIDNNTEIETANVRFVAVVGIDEKSFLERGKDEIYLHRPVRVWYNEKWNTGRIAGYGAHGLVEVRCDEKVTNNEDFLGGHGLVIGSRSFDLDLSDPSSPEKRHPLEDYPLIRKDNCIRFINSEGGVAYGWIDQINAEQKVMQVYTQLGIEQISFDSAFDVIDTPADEPADELVKKGSTFKVYDSHAGKDRVFEIKGVDKEDDLIIGRIVSLRPAGMSIAHVFPRSQVELLGDPNIVLEQYPYLKGKYRNYKDVTVRFRHEGEVLVGKLHTSETLPAFVEVIIEKDPPPKGDFADAFNRYDVKVEDLLGPVED